MIMRPEKDGEIVIDEQMIASSGKMIMLDRLLKELKKNNHRVRNGLKELVNSMSVILLLNLIFIYCEKKQGSKWDGMKRYAIPGLPLARTGIVIISIPAPLFSQFES